MLPKWHILTGVIFSILVYLLFHLTPLQTTIIFLSSILIDFDHYLYYAFKKKDFNPINAYHWLVKRRKEWIGLSVNEREQYKKRIFIFHGIEFWILLLALSLVYNPLFFVLAGIFFHMLFDYIELIYLDSPLYQKFSQIYNHMKNKGKREFQ
ncbi:MAG: hypothetical protein PHF67_03985 [Candidatus Nanoarchaeia archaeon]|nr:hypothetical protein [Candidatus Nanoarchaeia archaeon]